MTRRPAAAGVVELETVRGPARVAVQPADDLDAPLVLLLHGAGSGTDVPVLAALAAALPPAGLSVARLEQPYRVAGRRAPDRAAHLDAVLAEVVGALDAGGRLLLAGRSSGARVACRGARALGAVAVVALGFPLRPPDGRSDRQAELDAAGVPVLVVQGERDVFGLPTPDAARARTVHLVRGADHSLRPRRRDGRTEADCVAEAVAVTAAFLAQAGASADAPT